MVPRLIMPFTAAVSNLEETHASLYVCKMARVPREVAMPLLKEKNYDRANHKASFSDRFCCIGH